MTVSSLTTLELPLVVVQFLRRRRQRLLGLRLLYLVLHDASPYPRLYLQYSVFQLQLSGVRSVRPVDGDCGFLDGVCVCKEDL